MTNLALSLLDTAARMPGRPAIMLDDHVMTYAELDDASARVAGFVAGVGVAPGDRVGLMLPNDPAFAAAYYGLLRAGAIVVPMNPLLKTREVGYHLADSGARLLLAWHGVAADALAGASDAGAHCVLVDPATFGSLPGTTSPAGGAAAREPHDTAVILYTSGTTGQPKGAELTHANLTRNVEVTTATLLQLTEADVVFGGLPLFHAFGQVVALASAVAAGACLTLLPRFDPASALKVIERDRVSVFAGVPTMYSTLLRCPDRSRRDTSSLQLCVSGGAALPVEVLRGFEAEFGCMILEGYGLSETSPVACFNHPSAVRKPGSIGTPIAGVRMQIIDNAGTPLPPGEVGEIAVCGHNVMKGYWNRPEATGEAIRDGWLRTGDLGKLDEDGYFWIVDRAKDMIIRGGFNVYPREIEEVLYEHPAVAEAAVIGVPHPELGEEVAAAVVPRPGFTTTPDELREHVRSQVAPYKYPRVIWIASELPKGPTGKILKREILPPAGG